MKKLLYIPIIISIAIASCKKSEPEPDKDTRITEWVKQNMETYYYWEEEMPDINMKYYSDPSKYFNDLLVPQDKWSFIIDDYEGYTGTTMTTQAKTMGYEYIPFYYNDKKQVGLAIIVVYPNSPAQKAGLERGNYILKINDAFLTQATYSKNTKLENYSAEVYVDKNGSFTKKNTVNLTAQAIAVDPSIADTIIERDGKKIGYYSYLSFIAGDNDRYLKSMQNIFAKFKLSGIDELIVDLRYNSGGDVLCAQQLASLIAPSKNIDAKDIMVNLSFNKKLTASHTAYNPSNLYYKFIKLEENLNLKRVYFITTENSASSSELLIVSLQPYMDVKIIGENTHGKYMGMYVLVNKEHNWGMFPITMKYSNSVGYTDFINGLTPNIPVKYNWDTLVPFGNNEDPMVAAALNDILGTKSLNSRLITKYSNNFEIIKTKTEDPLKNNAVFPIIIKQ